MNNQLMDDNRQAGARAEVRGEAGLVWLALIFSLQVGLQLSVQMALN